MLLTKCASCAAELGLTSGKKCGRCATRYCGPACQKKHWEEGGHDQLCKQIKKSGGAEQYHADKMCAEAVAVAVAKCADDTAGQTCYICTEAVHRRTGEGLVRGCACGDRDGVAAGTAGVVHVSCLAEQAKLLVAEAEENNLDNRAFNERWARWETCGLCEQDYHGVVKCALGWACWKTYVGRPETNWPRRLAMTELGNGLSSAGHHEDALSVKQADLATRLRLGDSERNMLALQNNLASSYQQLGQGEQALRMKRDVYSGYLNLFGEEDEKTLQAALNYAGALQNLRRLKEARSLLRKMLPVAGRALGEGCETTLRMRGYYAGLLSNDGCASLDDLREAVTTFEEIEPTARRVLGGTHPLAMNIEAHLQNARSKLASFDALSEGVRDQSVS